MRAAAAGLLFSALCSAAFSAMTSDATPPRTVRIVALGDSTTAGTPGFASPLEAPPSGRGDVTSQYAYWLMQARPQWEVLNRGVNGERTDHILARFERDVLEARPAAVVIIAGVNDIYQGRPAADPIQRLDEMYRRAGAAGVRVVAGTIVPFNSATEDQNARMHAVNAWIGRRVRELNLEFADTRAAVAMPGKPDMLFETVDQLHPSPAGYRAMAEAIRPALERLLR